MISFPVPVQQNGSWSKADEADAITVASPITGRSGVTGRSSMFSVHSDSSPVEYAIEQKNGFLHYTEPKDVEPRRSASMCCFVTANSLMEDPVFHMPQLNTKVSFDEPAAQVESQVSFEEPAPKQRFLWADVKTFSQDALTPEFLATIQYGLGSQQSMKAHELQQQFSRLSRVSFCEKIDEAETETRLSNSTGSDEPVQAERPSVSGVSDAGVSEGTRASCASIDMPKDVEADEEVTTLMIIGIPTKYTQDMLMEEIASFGFHINFCYLPSARRGKCRGFGFVNFLSVEDAESFKQVFNTHVFREQNDKGNRAEVKPSVMQGLEKNVAFYEEVKQKHPSCNFWVA